jgi:uncharacterized protein YjbI with pentapeptide repeats
MCKAPLRCVAPVGRLPWTAERGVIPPHNHNLTNQGGNGAHATITPSPQPARATRPGGLCRLHNTRLHGAHLSEANLSDAQVTDEQLAEATTLEGATLPDGTVHE